MGIYDKVRRWLRRESEQRYDNVTVVNPVDGTTIKGHDAVKDYFRKEMDLLDEHGSSIIFQVYRINLQAKAITELQGEKLVEIKVDGEFVSGTDTVAAVKKKVRRLLDGAGRPKNDAGAQPDLDMQKADRVTLVFNGHPMRDDKMFFADHCMLLPVWVQVFVHRCEFEEVTELARRLRHAASE